MDNFTKMCEAANLPWEPKVGDWTDKGLIVESYYSLSASKRVYVLARGKDELEKFIEKNELIYLPTIGQLMGMVDNCAVYKHPDVICATAGRGELFEADSEPEALIQAVVHELHNKKWDGERWNDENQL